MILKLTKKILERKYKIFSISNGTIISSILILSTVLMPISMIPKKAKAQTMSGYLGGLTGAISALPQCGGGKLIGSGVNALFSGIGSLFSSNNNDNNDSYNSTGYSSNSSSSNIDDGVIFDEQDEMAKGREEAKKYEAEQLEKKSKEARDEFYGVQIYDPTSYANQKEMKEALARIEKSSESINSNSTCIQSIGRLVIKMLLQKMTVSTVNWINSGFEGSPSFIQDPEKFFGDIAKNEVLQFGLEITDPELFPFGKDWIRNNALTFNNKFQDNARYSLDELIKKTNPEYDAVTFGQDFSMGGWDAWTAMTQIPANNPLGFKLMADNEIQKRLTGTAQSVAQNTRDALKEANGFLGDQRCVDPKGMTREQDLAIKNARGAKADKNGYVPGSCAKWEYVTPGKMISDKATEAIGYQNNAYLNVEDLNDAFAAIIDSLLGQFSTNIIEKGFVNIGKEGASGALVYESIKIDPYKSQVEKDFIPSQLSSSWLKANPKFNIRTDLTQALIDEQRTYSDKLTQQNKELLSTTDGKDYKMGDNGISNAYGLIPVIHQLDYCIPGPHPGWEEDSQRVLNAVTDTILPETKESLKDKDLEKIVGIAKSILPMAGAAAGAALVVGTGASATLLGVSLGAAAGPVGILVGAIVGTLVGFLGDLFSSSDDGDKVRAYYSNTIGVLTGYLPNYDSETSKYALNIESKQGAVGVLNTMLARYGEIINKAYFSDTEILPLVAKEARTIYYQLPGYGQIMKSNEDKISLLKGVILTLGNIKDEIEKLNNEYPTPKDRGEEYENKLKTQINAFGRLSANMVNGDDIANADNLLKQIIDKKNHIYKDLLKDPSYGCEAHLKNIELKKFPWPYKKTAHESWLQWDNYYVNSIKRMEYPSSLPIIYDYNKLTKNTEIPDPLNSGFKTKNIMPSTTDDQLGPGFLSFILFSTEGPENNKDLRRGPERLPIHDLVPQDQNVNSRYRATGLRKKMNATSSDSTIGGPFETIIGVY